MKQSRLMSFTESTINILVGFGISLTAQWFFLPLLGVTISLTQNVIFAVIMTVISIARSYLLRRIFETLHIRTPLSPAMLAIIAERERQKSVEGWTEDHDDKYPPGELARAGAAYALYAPFHSSVLSTRICHAALSVWPWKQKWWKPTGFRRDMVKAGALIVAEIERSDRDRNPAALRSWRNCVALPSSNRAHDVSA